MPLRSHVLRVGHLLGRAVSFTPHCLVHPRLATDMGAMAWFATFQVGPSDFVGLARAKRAVSDQADKVSSRTTK